MGSRQGSEQGVQVSNGPIIFAGRRLVAPSQASLVEKENLVLSLSHLKSGLLQPKKQAPGTDLQIVFLFTMPADSCVSGTDSLSWPVCAPQSGAVTTLPEKRVVGAGYLQHHCQKSSIPHSPVIWR